MYIKFIFKKTPYCGAICIKFAKILKKLLSISIKKGPEGFLRDEQRHDLGIYRQTTQIRTCC